MGKSAVMYNYKLFVTHSVATVMTDVFQKNGIMVSRKLARIVRIFVDMGHIKTRGVIYWPERIGPVIPTLWSSHDFSQRSGGLNEKF
jgi:hypothetical protein